MYINKYVRAILFHIYIQPHIVMLKLTFLIVCLGIFTSGRANDLLGYGLWTVLSVTECPDHDGTNDTVKMEVNKHKLNRTVDGYTAHITIKQEVTEEYGVTLNLCKFVDGGCKPYHDQTDNLGRVCDQYAKEHVKRAFKASTYEKEYLPLPEGEYDLEDYMIDYCDLPAICLFGKFQALIYLLNNQQRVFCIKLVIECKKCEEDEDCCGREVRDVGLLQFMQRLRHG